MDNSEKLAEEPPMSGQVRNENDPDRFRKPAPVIELTPDVIANLRRLLDDVQQIASVTGLPWRSEPCSGKPVLCANKETKGCTIAYGTLGSWKEIDLAVAAVNALPALLEAIDTRPHTTGDSDLVETVRAALIRADDELTRPTNANFVGVDVDYYGHLARAAIEAALSTQAAEIERVQHTLGAPSEWADKQSELLRWTGSAFLAGEPVEDEAECRGQLYSFLCGMIGWLATGEAAARQALSDTSGSAK